MTYNGDTMLSEFLFDFFLWLLKVPKTDHNTGSWLWLAYSWQWDLGKLRASVSPLPRETSGSFALNVLESPALSHLTLCVPLLWCSSRTIVLLSLSWGTYALFLLYLLKLFGYKNLNTVIPKGGGLPLLKGEEEGRMGGGSVLLGAERRRGADIEM